VKRGGGRYCFEARNWKSPRKRDTLVAAVPLPRNHRGKNLMTAGASNAETIEAIRACYRPELIATLFVGESAPVGGTFFYTGSRMTGYMKRAVDESLGPSDVDFLERFKSFCWFLDDLSLEPVNGLGRAERRAVCLEAQPSLASRIAEYQPQAIVILLMSIRDIVEAAITAAGCKTIPYAVPFPGNGQQARFRNAMSQIIPILPRCGKI
jgi:hypothetical protein